MSFTIISDPCHYDANGTIMLRNDLLSKEEEERNFLFLIINNATNQPYVLL